MHRAQDRSFAIPHHDNQLAFAADDASVVPSAKLVQLSPRGRDDGDPVELRCAEVQIAWDGLVRVDARLRHLDHHGLPLPGRREGGLVDVVVLGDAPELHVGERHDLCVHTRLRHGSGEELGGCRSRLWETDRVPPRALHWRRVGREVLPAGHVSKFISRIGTLPTYLHIRLDPHLCSVPDNDHVPLGRHGPVKAQRRYVRLGLRRTMTIVTHILDHDPWRHWDRVLEDGVQRILARLAGHIEWRQLVLQELWRGGKDMISSQ